MNKIKKDYWALIPIFIAGVFFSFFYLFLNKEYPLQRIESTYKDQKIYISFPKSYLPIKKYAVLIAFFEKDKLEMCKQWKNFSNQKNHILVCVSNQNSKSAITVPLLSKDQMTHQNIQALINKLPTHKSTLIGYGKSAETAMNLGLIYPASYPNIISFYYPRAIKLQASNPNKNQRILVIGNKSFFNKRNSLHLFNTLKESEHQVRLWLYPYLKAQIPLNFELEMNKAFRWFYGKNKENRQDILDLL